MARQQRQAAPSISFDVKLILFRYFLHELKIEALSELGEKLNTPDFEGVNESGNTYFCDYLIHTGKLKGATIPAEKLRLYDENICRHTRQISEKRGTIRWKYFQYISLLLQKCISIDIFRTGRHFVTSSINF